MSKRISGRSSAFSRKPVVIATEIAIAMLAAQVAYGQQVSQAPVERVEITGSRLPQLTTEGVTPVSTLTAQDIKLDGLTKAEDLLRNLPQAYQNQGTYQSNGSTGTATIDLRGLGPTRNLVLINGRRMVPGSPTQGGYAPDLNQIPTPLIQRVELLTGGNSAIYGSDAISGVINFIMNDKFEGLRIDVNHSFYNHQQNNPHGIADIVAARALTNPRQFVVPGDVTSDGDIHDISMTLGGNFANGKGNATLFLGYKREDPVLQASRDFSACALNPGASFTCGGSSTSVPGRFFTLGGAGPSRTVADAFGNTRAFSAATDQFNFAPYNFYQRNSERYMINGFAHLDVDPHARVYAEIGFHQDHTLSQIAPSGLFTQFVTVSSENPLIPNVLGPNTWRTDLGLGLIGSNTTADLLIARRNQEGGGRQDDIKHTSFRMVFGMKGDIFKHWNYDLFAQTSRVALSRTYRNDFSITRSLRALDVVSVGGVPTCASVVNGTDPNCVPYDVWRLNAITGASLAYLQIPLLANGSTQQQVQGGTLTADLGNYGVKTPWAKDGVGFVFGLERRKEKLELETDTNFSSGDGAGQGGATIGRSGKVTVNEWFTEVRVPLIEGRRFVDLLSVNGSYRHSGYNTGIKTNTYGFGAEWAPIKQYRLRASYQHAIRAANINELFLAQGNNLFDLSRDPCGAAALAASSVAALTPGCANTGLPAALIGSPILDNPAGQYNFLQGGNPALRPEEADTYTVGLVFNPIRNLTGSLDWWSITIDGAIGNAPPTTILDQCFRTGAFCGSVQRDFLGTLWVQPTGRVIALNDNLGGYKVNGLDLALNYLQRVGRFGSLNFNYNGSWLNKWEFEPIRGLGKFDCAGFVGPQCGFPLPQYRHKARVTWTTPWNVDVALTWRHISKVKNEFSSGDPDLANPPVDATDRELASRNYVDLAASWQVDKSLTIRAGVNNIADKDPPIVGQGLAGPSSLGNGNTFPSTYDTLGRTIFIGLTAKW